MARIIALNKDDADDARNAVFDAVEALRNLPSSSKNDELILKLKALGEGIEINFEKVYQ